MPTELKKLNGVRREPERRGQMPPVRGGGERITNVETSKNSEMERGAPEEQMATYERGNGNEEGTV